MIPARFDYIAAQSVRHATELLKQYGDGAKILAGGHTLLPVLKLRMAAPEILIDIGKLAELKGIAPGPGKISIGALTTHGEIARSDTLKKYLPLMTEAAEQIADPLVRNRGTIGGSLVNADPSADWPAIMLALNARMRLVNGTQERQVAVEDFFVGMFTSATRPDELLAQIDIPVLPVDAQSTYLKFRHPASGYAVAGVACVWVSEHGVCRDCRIALTGVAEQPFRAHAVERALIGKRTSRADIEESVALVTSGIDVLSDGFADQDYRSNLARVLTLRALQKVAKP